MTKLALVSLSLFVACGPAKAPPQGPVAGGPVEGAPPMTEPAAPQPPAPAPVAGKPKQDLIPRAVAFGNPDRANVQISPDGKQLSWLAAKDGVLNVWVAPVDKPDQAKVITAETTRPVREYLWAYTGKHILYKQDAAGDENFHILRADVADGKVTDLTPAKGARSEFAALDPRFPTKLMITINDRDPKLFDVHEVDIVSGKHTLAAQNDDNFVGYTIDNDMKVRFASKKQADGGTAVVQAETKAGKITWKPFDSIPFEDAETTAMLAFAPDGKSVYANESRGRDTAALVAVDLATKKAKPIAEDAKADVGALIIHPTKHNVQAVAFNYDRVRWQVIDKSIAKDLDALAKVDGGEVNVGARTLDDKRWVVSTASDVHPRRYYLWDRTAQKATFLFAAQPELDKQPLVKMHPVVIKSRDGLDMVSYLTLPAGADPDGDGKANSASPMVLFVHGGPWARDAWGFNRTHQLLANRGYAVLSVNYRGSTGFGKKFLNAANLQWGKAMHDDLIDAVNWAVTNGVAPKDKVGIMGGSYGGYATLAGLTLTPDVFACGVDLVGVSNLHTFIASIPPYWAPELATLRTRVGDWDTADGKALLTASSPITHVSKIKRPLLIGQGANDPRVKQAESEQIVAEMKKHRLPVTYALFPDEGHGFARPVNNIAFFALTEAFLSAHLGGYYLPMTKDEVEASTMQLKDGREGIPGLP